MTEQLPPEAQSTHSLPKLDFRESMTGNISPQFARAIQVAEHKVQEKEALKREKAAREGESKDNEGLGTGLWPFLAAKRKSVLIGVM